MQMLEIVRIIVILFNFLVFTHCKRSDEEAKLVDQLLESYDDATEPESLKNININIKLRSVQEIGEKNQFLASSVYFQFKWIDSRLSWTNQKLKQVYIRHSYIWFPKFWVGNDLLEIPPNLLVNVRKNGTITAFLFSSSIKTQCNFSPFYFPFDKQICSIKIQYIDNTNLTSSIIHQKNNLEIENSVWKIDDSNVQINNDKNGVELFRLEKVQELVFSMTLKRKSFHFVLSHIFPLILLNVILLFMFTFSSRLRLGLATLEILILGFYPAIIESVYLSESLLHLYFSFSFAYASISFIWFVFSSSFEASLYLPGFLIIFAEFLHSLFSFNTENSKISERQNDKITQKPQQMKRQVLRNLNSIPLHNDQQKCFNCNCCEECQRKRDELEQKDLLNKQIKFYLHKLNNFVFFLIFSLIFICNLIIVIRYKNQD